MTEGAVVPTPCQAASQKTLPPHLQEQSTGIGGRWSESSIALLVILYNPGRLWHYSQQIFLQNTQGQAAARGDLVVQKVCGDMRTRGHASLNVLQNMKGLPPTQVRSISFVFPEDRTFEKY